MNKIITHLDLDLASSNEYKIINAQQLDNNTRRLEVNLFHEGKIYDISNVTRIELQGSRGDGLVIKTTLSHNGNTIIIDFDDTILGAKGLCKLKIALYNSGELLSSFPFIIRVDENVYDENGIIASPVYSELDETLKKVKDIETKESSRVEAENKRVSSEQARNNAESTRIKAEESRVSSENERRNSETSRASEFTNMKNELSEIVENNKNINIEAIAPDDEHYQVKVTDKNGVSKTSANLLNKLSIGTVETGEYDEIPTANITGKFGEQKLNLRLPTGKPFKIKKTYSSITDMNQNIQADLNLYEFCMINTGNVEDEDTAKLYMRDVDGAHYITDLSGAQGIQGVKGETGITPNLTIGTVETGEPGTQASATITGDAENPILNLTIPRGMTGKVENISGESIPYTSSDNEKSIKDVVDDKLGKTEQASDSATVNGHTVESNVPANAQFTDTTYTSKSAVSGGTDVSLVTTGEKAIWNAKSTGESNRLTYYETRPTSADKASSSDRIGSIEAFVASSSMTTGKPMADAKILQMNWDNTSGWDSQLAMTNNGTLQHRAMASGTWKTWKTILDSSNYTNYVDSALSSTSTNPVQNKVINTAIEALKKSVSDGKGTVASAITNMGVSTASDATFATMATNVKKIFPTPAQFAAKYKNIQRNLINSPINLSEANATFYDDTIIIHGNNVSGVDNKLTYKYSPKNNTWTQNSSSPIGHCGSNTAILIGDDIYYFGTEATTAQNLYTYNSATNTWKDRLVTMPLAVQKACVVYHCGFIILFGAASKYFYNLQSNTFTKGNDLPSNILSAIKGGKYSTPVIVNNMIYFICSDASKVIAYDTCGNKYLMEWTAPGSSFGSAVRVGASIYISSMKYANFQYIFRTDTGTFTSLGTGFFGYRTAMTKWGDEIFLFGSAISGQENKAANIHTSYFLDNLY